MDIEETATEMRRAAAEAANRFFKDELNGHDQYPCGFAWVTICPQHKGNTRPGREERKILEKMGFKKDWTGKAYQIWNPSGHNCQNMYAKEAGARAAAEVLKTRGFRAYTESRMD